LPVMQTDIDGIIHIRKIELERLVHFKIQVWIFVFICYF
jgi:hypothetical protein